MIVFFANQLGPTVTFPNFEHFPKRGGEKTMINKVIIRAKSALRRLKSKKGQTLVEYALILAFISVVAISVLIALGNQVKSVFTTISSQLSAAQTSH
jgi:Flp pilus assembly pilin Flp